MKNINISTDDDNVYVTMGSATVLEYPRYELSVDADFIDFLTVLLTNLGYQVQYERG